MNDKLNIYIDKGMDVGRIANPDTAFEVASTINEGIDVPFPPGSDFLHKLWWRATHAKSRYAAGEGTKSADSQAQKTVDQAQKTVDAERRDTLTDLQNKTAYEQDRRALYRHLSQNEEIIVVQIDMGLLNYFNQARGSDVGDLYLKKAATLIDGTSFSNTQHIFQSCSFAQGYHKSGDEFVVLLKTGKNSAREVESSIRKSLAENMAILDLPGGNVVIGDSDQAYAVQRDVLLDLGITTAGHANDMIAKVLAKAGLSEQIQRSELLEITVDRIAEVRMNIHKAIKRIGMLRQLLLEDERLFNQVYPYAAKGAFAIHERNLKQLDSEPYIKSWVTDIYRKRLKNEAQRMTDPFQKHLFLTLAEEIQSYVNEA